MIVLIVTIGPATDCSEPGARNSNRLPVNANGLVRLRSPGSVGRTGSVSTPIISVPFSFDDVAPPLAIWSKTSASWSPRKIEMIAGGASLAPRRWSLLAEATEARSRPPYLCTMRMIAAQKTRNCAFSCGVSPGSSRLPSLALPIEKLTCLPEPLTPCERLLVEQAFHAVLVGEALERGHHQLLVVGGLVGPLEHRRQLELAGRDLLVAGLGRDAELEQLALAIHHVAEHPLGDRAEVVVVELLALRRLGAEQRPSGVEQVGPGQEEVPVDQEVLLLGAAERHDVVGIRVAEQPQHPLGVLGHRLLRAQQRGLVVERVAEHRHEDRRDAERLAVRVVEHVRRAGRIPAGVAAGLERVAQAAAREARPVRLALGQGLAGELGQRQPAAAGLEEAVVLLRGQAGQRIEDVRVVRRALLHRPVLHRRGDGVGHHRVERLGVLDRGQDRLVDQLGQPLLHHRQAEDVLAEDRAGDLARLRSSAPAARRPRRP